MSFSFVNCNNMRLDIFSCSLWIIFHHYWKWSHCRALCRHTHKKNSMATECLFKDTYVLSSLQAELYEDSSTPGEVLWGPSDPQKGSLYSLQANYRELLLRKRHHRGWRGYTGLTPNWSVYLNAVLGPLAAVKGKRKMAMPQLFIFTIKSTF